METEEIQNFGFSQKGDNNKREAKKIKEEGNAHYKKKNLDMAIQKYDQVIFDTKNDIEKLPKNSDKIS